MVPGHHSLRDYQTEGISAIQRSWESKKHPMVSVATGGGKTVMISQLLVKTLPPTERALIVAHTEEIVQQIYITVRRHYNHSVGIVMGSKNDIHSQIIVASRQSLGAKRLSKILKHGKISLLVIDEAHHATSENTYGEIVNHVFRNNPRTKLVGFTATPTRSDQQGTDEQGDLFDEIVFSWTIADGVKSGFLVPAWQIEVKIEISPRNYVSVLECKNWIDYTIKSYETFILSSKRPCLAFFPSVKMSRQFTRALKRKGYKAAHVDGNTPKEERESTLTAYKQGDIQIVCNMEVLTEGFDAPNTSAILLARPTKSRTLFTQILGRGLRISDNKKDCLVVNLVPENDSFTINDILGYRYPYKNKRVKLF